jgi:putative tryptophan/tyrosine transport system substrate-binding protein
VRRREFITLLGSAAAWPLAARAQQSGRLPLIGILDFFPSAASADSIEPFQQGLRELGYVNGRNIHLEYHSASNAATLPPRLPPT